MSKETIMAGDATSAEIQSVGAPGQGGVAILERPGTESEKPAISPEDRNRLQQAEAILGPGIQLISDKKEATDKGRAILRAHYEATGELGTNGNPASVGYYTEGQLLRKAEILKKADFTEEERRKLFEAGLVGAVPSHALDILKPDDYTADPALKGIVDEVLVIGTEELADEGVFTEYLARLNGLVDRGEVTDKTLAMKLRLDLVKLRNYALHPDTLTTIEQTTRPGTFARARAMFEYSNGHATWQAEIERLAHEAEQEPAKPLELIRQRLFQFYKDVKNTRRSEHLRSGGGRQSVIDHGKQPGGLGIESIWNKFPGLRVKYQGLAQYVWEGVVEEIDEEENGTSGPSLNPLAKAEFAEIKRLRQKDRQKENKFETTQSWYGGELIYTFDWPENAPEMVLSAQAWVRDQIEKIGESRDPETTGKALQQIRERGVLLIENSVNRLNNEEGQNITKTNQYFIRARAFIEAIPEIFGNEKMLEARHPEQGPGYKERFAARFIVNHNAAYLENTYAAYIMHRLAKVKNGTYWAGQSLDEEKVGVGKKDDYREAIQKEIEDDALTVDFFAETIFAAYPDLFPKLTPIQDRKENEGKGFFELREKYHLDYGFNDPLERMLLDPVNQIRDRIAATGDQEALKRHSLRIDVFRRIWALENEKEGLGLVTNQERGQAESRKGRRLTDKELLALAERKKQVLRDRIKQGQPLIDPDRIEVAIRVRMEQQRQAGIRERIVEQMQANAQNSFMAERSQQVLAEYYNAGDEIARNEIIWGWVKEYDAYSIEFQRLRDLGEHERYYPSGWDRVRIKIDRPTKLIDRSLSDDEFEAMYERIDLTVFRQRPDWENIKNQNIEEVRFGFDIARSYEIFLMQDVLLGGIRTRLMDKKTGKYIGKLEGDDEETKWVNRRLGLTDVNGDAINPNRKLVRVWDVIQARLEKAIADEEKAINEAKEAHALGGITKAALTEILVNAQFVVTHALKEIGLVEGRLPSWSQNFLDSDIIDEFTQVLADYGLEIGTGNVLMDHNRKLEIYELLERERRALQAEKDRAVKEFMESSFPVFEKDDSGNIIYDPVLDENNQPRKNPDGSPMLTPRPSKALISVAGDRGEDRDLRERMRIVNSGALPGDRMVFDGAYELPTSGGVVAPEFIPDFGDYGFNPLLVWMGTPTVRELNNYIKRRSEQEFHEDQFFTERDFSDNAKAQAQAYNVRKTLVGGVVEINGEKKYTPGLLNDTFWASVNINAVLRKWQEEQIAQRQEMRATVTYLGLMHKWRYSRGEFTEADTKEMEKQRQMTYLDFPREGITLNIEQYFKEYEVLKYLVWYFEAERAVEENRIPDKATRNYPEHNAQKYYAFRRILRNAVTNERGFIVRHGFSPEIASEISIRMIEQVLEEADYQILPKWEREFRALEGAKFLARTLTPQEIGKGFGIPDEKDWLDPLKVRPAVRKALEGLRSRGRLEFMREEGYLIVNKKGEALDAQGNVVSKNKMRKILGYEMPPVVRKLAAEGKLVDSGYPAGKYLDILPSEAM